MIAASRPVRSLAQSRSRPSRVVGVYFDDGELSAVECRRRRGKGPIIVRAGRSPLAAGVVEHGEIVDGPAFSEALRQLWRKHGFRSRNVVLGLDGRTTVIRQAELPALSSTELAQAAAYEIDELLSFPLDEAVLSTLELERREFGEREVVRTITVAASEDGLLAIHGAVKDAGLRLVSTELVASWLLAAVGRSDDQDDTHGQPSQRDDVVVASNHSANDSADDLDLVVHITSTTTLVAVGNERGLAFSRVITAGVNAGATSLSDELEMELALLAGYTEAPEDPETMAADRPAAGIATVVEGVRRTVQYFRDEVDRRPIGRLLLCGPQSDVGGLASGLTASIPDARVLRLDLSGFAADIDHPSTYDAAASVAIATTAGTGPQHRFDLTPHATRERRAARHRIAIGAVAAALIVPPLTADALDRRAMLEDEQALAAATQVAVDGLRADLVALEPALQLEAEAQRATARVNDLRRLNLGFEPLVQQVAETMPDDTFLISLSLGRAANGELPTGYTGDPPPATITLTGVASDLDGVGRWLQTVDDVSAIDGLWLTQSAVGPYGATDQIATVFTVDGAVTGPGEPADLLSDLDDRSAADGGDE